MSKEILVPDFLRDIVAKCNFTVKVNSSVYDAANDVTTLYMCNTYHITKCSIVSYAGTDYEVTEVSNNEYIVIKGDVTFITDVVIPAPFFRQGTPLQVQQSFANIRDYKDKLPMIWLVEPFKTHPYEDKKSKLAYDADIVLLFVLPQFNADELVDEQYVSLINPIHNLIGAFREFVRKSPLVENFNTKSTAINRVNMGEWVSKDGARKPMEDNIKRLLNELTTATEYSMSFSIKKSNQCCGSINETTQKIYATAENSEGTELASKYISGIDNTIPIPDINFTDSTGVVTSEPSGVDLACSPNAAATVENSDGSYTNTVIGGGTLVLPNILFIDSTGIINFVPSVKNITATPQDNTKRAELPFILDAAQCNTIFTANGVTTFTTIESSVNIGTLTISTDDVTFTPFSLPFTPTAGIPYYFKRTGTGTGNYIIKD